MPNRPRKGDKKSKRNAAKANGKMSSADSTDKEGEDDDDNSSVPSTTSSATGRNSRGSGRSGFGEKAGSGHEDDEGDVESEDGEAEREGEEIYSGNEGDKEFNDLLVNDYEEYLLEQQQREQEEEDDEGGEEEKSEAEEMGEEGKGGGIQYDLDGEGSSGGQGGIPTGSEENKEAHDLGAASITSARTGTSKANRAVAAAITARRQLQQQRVDYASLATYLMNGSSIASVFLACLHLENEDVYHQAQLRIAALTAAVAQESDYPEQQSDKLEAEEVEVEEEEDGDRTSSRIGLLHPDLDLDYLMKAASSSSSEGGNNEEERSGVDGGGRVRELARIPLESVSKAMLELKEQGVSGFLVDLVLAPRRAARTHALSWCSWRTLLEVLRRGLKTDFDALQDWRIEAGLLKPEAIKVVGAGKGVELTAKQEKALEKKEKVKKLCN